MLLLIFLKDNNPGSAQAAYEHAEEIFQRGDLAKGQREAQLGQWQFQVSNPEWAAKFQLLEAETMLRRGLYDSALHLLAGYHPDSRHPEETVRELAVEALALTRQGRFSAADQRLIQAESLCKSADYTSCGNALRSRGILASRQGQSAAAQEYFTECLFFARAHRDRWAEIGALNSLGFGAIQTGHFDEAVDWLRSAHWEAVELDSDYWRQTIGGNLGWAYYQLGDDERALEQFVEAEKRTEKLRDIGDELKWTSTAGYVYHDTGDLNRAAQSYLRALNLAKQIDSKEDILNALGDLAQISVETGKLDEASAYLDQLKLVEGAGTGRLRASVMMTQGMLAAARRQHRQAETLFRAIQDNPENPTMIRLSAGDELALLFESEGNDRAAERSYKATLTAFEAARAQLKGENSRLPFAGNAMVFYDNYIHLLVKEGRGDEALAVAEQSRAQTLEQDLGMADGKASFHTPALNPRRVAQQAGATLLFYWLGVEQSYLWAITPAKITLLRLPAEVEIIARVKRYRKALLDMEDPRQAGNVDGQELYKLLVAPAAKLIRSQAPVMILDDGALGLLNFETLLAPGPGPGPKEIKRSGKNPEVHYWIEDATLLSAPSLNLLAAAKPARNAEHNLLLLGNPVAASPEYPSLPFFGAEMNRIQRHFAARQEAVFAGEQATPAAYLSGHPAQFAYIHFVSHAVASRMDPLDSAIILSGGKAGEASFKLHARDIMRHPIDARLVTISACYGSGTRSYAGEGLVGLSWAFLSAGAHNVIGALWEVSDDSTPRLMDTLYQGLQDGQAPAVALRNAQLGLLHSHGRFSQPFYWAPFQIYTRR